METRHLVRRLAGNLLMVAMVLPVTPTGAEMLPDARLGRGIAIHEVLNWPIMINGSEPSYAWPPFSTERYALRSEELVRLKQVGFDTIRLTVGIAIFLSADKERSRELDAILLNRVTRLIESGFTVIVDFHPVDQDPRFPPLSLTRGPDEPQVEAFRALLMRTAVNLSHLPKDRIVLEILNEPRTRDYSQDEANLWRRTQKHYFDSIRAVASDLVVMVTGCCVCCGLELTMLDPSDYPDRNVYFTFHFYAPHGFTHQGVRDRNRPFAPTYFLKGVPFPLTGDGLADVERRARAAVDAETIPALQARWKAKRDMETAITRLRQFSSPVDLETVFDKTLDWARKNGISPSRVFLGEFGVMRPNVDPSSRRNWLEAVRIAAERRQMPWSYWSLEGPEYMGLHLDRKTRAFDPLILDALGLVSLQNR